MKNQPASVQYSSPSAAAGSSSQNGRQEAKDSGIDTAHCHEWGLPLRGQHMVAAGHSALHSLCAFPLSLLYD